MAQKDYYAILGVPPTASQAEIRDAYRRLVRHYHPDLNPEREDAEARIKELNEAYEVLGDPARRARYDRTRPVRIPVRVGAPRAPSASLDLSGAGRSPSPTTSATHVDLSGYGRFPGAMSATPAGYSERWHGSSWEQDVLAAELAEAERLLWRWRRLLQALLDW